MPGRKVSLAVGEAYHVFNRGIDRRPTFTTDRERERAKLACDFYRFADVGISLSRFVELSPERQRFTKDEMSTQGTLVNFLAYCFMDNHFHFLIRQNRDGGISKFLGNFQNSYTRYFNLKNQRQGPLFSTQFRAVRIETEEQLLHVIRYIHLNPYTSHLVNSIQDLKSYPWSSLKEYLDSSLNKICQTNEILGFFKSADDYLKFVSDQAEYQRHLKQIEHLLLE